ncbi:MAG: glycosyltransferase family 2 protein [Planctomycetota bacterium]
MSRLPLSVIVAFHDMQREAPRTLHSLSPGYQRGVSADDYEVLAVDVGSEPALEDEYVRAAGPRSRLLRFPRGPSPAAAINAAVAESRGDAVMVCIDGARILSPGIVRWALAALRGFADPLVATVSWHLGPKVQHESMLEGYGQAAEDRLLDSIDWRRDGYALFTVSSLAQSSRAGWLGPIGESNCMALRRDSWHRLGGYDERFTSPGGGFVNPDFFNRACGLLGQPVILLGEGTFHQFHGGVATNVPRVGQPLKAMAEEYKLLRGGPFTQARVQPTLLGGFHETTGPWLARAVEAALAAGAPPGQSTDQPVAASPQANSSST